MIPYLNLALDHVDGVGALHLEGDCLSCEKTWGGQNKTTSFSKKRRTCFLVLFTWQTEREHLYVFHPITGQSLDENLHRAWLQGEVVVGWDRCAWVFLVFVELWIQPE
jgi:hypothetical protein